LAQTVVVHPKLIPDVLVNPGMGIQTFQRYNGDALNTGVKWSEEGPTETLTAPANPVDFPPSTIAYCRWFWETLEPEQGRLRWDIIDRALADAAKHGQQLAIRLMPYDQKHPLPKWYQTSGAKRINREGDKHTHQTQDCPTELTGHPGTETMPVPLTRPPTRRTPTRRAFIAGTALVTLLPLVFVLTMLTTAALNVAIDRVAYRPLRRSPRLAPLITAIGVSFMLENVALLWKGPAPIAYPDVFPSFDILREWFGVDSAIFLTSKDLLVVAATLPLMVALHYFVTRTRWGKAMRATAQDRETAQAMGINVERTILITFFVGGALAGAAGLIQGMYYNIGQWWMGYQAGLRAFTAAVLGGIGSMSGAALGGLLIGFLSAWSDQYISARWTNAIVFSILIVVLVFRPRGLMGEASADKA